MKEGMDNAGLALAKTDRQTLRLSLQTTIHVIMSNWHNNCCCSRETASGPHGHQDSSHPKKKKKR